MASVGRDGLILRRAGALCQRAAISCQIVPPIPATCCMCVRNRVIYHRMEP